MLGNIKKIQLYNLKLMFINTLLSNMQGAQSKAKIKQDNC